MTEKKEYIEREALIKKIFPFGRIHDGNYTIHAKAVRYAIETAPAADVVEVVRCGQCKHWKINPNNLYGGYCRYCEGAKIDHFCSYGERKQR